MIQPGGNRSILYRSVKRCLDVGGSLALLAALSPVMTLTLIVLTISTRGKPLFLQRRLGHCGRVFTIIKFRTMLAESDDGPQTGNVGHRRRAKRPNDFRVTKVGRFLRCTSIDETPQLLNVLAGQMSLVGPRPIIAEDAAPLSAWQRRRFSVQPGLTCLWQVAGRSEISFRRWVSMDLWYVRNQSLLTDLILLARTPQAVFTRRGAY